MQDVKNKHGGERGTAVPDSDVLVSKRHLANQIEVTCSTEQTSPSSTELQKHRLPAHFHSFANIIFRSAQMRSVCALVERVAKTNVTVLIMGESGTGKELVARAIHDFSKLTGRFVAINCGAIPEDLLESELFGHEKGAFTGAQGSRVGYFKQAEGGTLFLDEIGEMSPKLQVKLLRALQERQVQPLGSTTPVSINARIVAATNVDLKKEVDERRFRQDLYHRLHVVPVEIPPLRSRVEDVEVLVNYYLAKLVQEHRVPQLSLTEEAFQALLNYDWPGNVRELENMMERLVVLAHKPVIGVEDLPKQVQVSAKEICEENFSAASDLTGPVKLEKLVQDYEFKIIQQVLDAAKGNKSLAAERLGIGRTTLVEKLRRQGVEAEGRLSEQVEKEFSNEQKLQVSSDALSGSKSNASTQIPKIIL